MRIKTITRILAEGPPGAVERQNDLRLFVQDVQRQCPGTPVQTIYHTLGRAYRQSGRSGTRASLMAKVLDSMRAS
jgi:hypothetical protein